MHDLDPAALSDSGAQPIRQDPVVTKHEDAPIRLACAQVSGPGSEDQRFPASCDATHHPVPCPHRSRQTLLFAVHDLEDFGVRMAPSKPDLRMQNTPDLINLNRVERIQTGNP